VGIGASFIIFFLYKKLLEKHTKRSFDDLSRKTLSEIMPQLFDLAKRELGSVREEINKDVSKEKGLIAESLQNLEHNIKEKQEELKNLAKEGSRQFGSISESIKSHKEVAEKLNEKTDTLSKILSNNKLRGNWGERVAEDILRYAGFLEGVHYAKQSAGTTGTIPDFTLFLPDKRKVNIDVKFPLSNLQAYQEAEVEEQKKEYMREFSQDIKTKIREVTSRSYISEEDNTLDFVILFVPSEKVHGFINDYLADVVDIGFQKKVLLTSPSSLYATLRIIMESYRNFMYEQNIREVIKIIQGFIENFKRFQVEFTEFDGAIERLRKTYDQIVETRYKMMRAQIKKIEKIEGMKNAQLP
jgi:DNA recombination protein RmuC